MTVIHRMEIPVPFAVETFNVFLVEGETLTLIDTGTNTEESRLALEKQLDALGYKVEDIETVVNASFNFDDKRYEEKGKLNHLIGSITTLDIDFGDFDVVEVPACTWAIFSCKGLFPTVFQDTWAKILSEWLPSSNYELINVPEISFNRDMSDMQNVYSEIWIGVKEK